ncbi:hypothetical protein BURPS305_6144 [Burkholderia pseudomallei 305]|nr:hypothetical protein BURPS305_6144 [Burkholderia pseudomallei 305]
MRSADSTRFVRARLQHDVLRRARSTQAKRFADQWVARAARRLGARRRPSGARARPVRRGIEKYEECEIGRTSLRRATARGDAQAVQERRERAGNGVTAPV